MAAYPDGGGGRGAARPTPSSPSRSTPPGPSASPPTSRRGRRDVRGRERRRAHRPRRRRPGRVPPPARAPRAPSPSPGRRPLRASGWCPTDDDGRVTAFVEKPPPGRGADQPDQRRHLRARADRSSTGSRRPAGVDRARDLPGHGPRRRALRHGRRRLLARHRDAGRLPAGQPRPRSRAAAGRPPCPGAPRGSAAAVGHGRARGRRARWSAPASSATAPWSPTAAAVDRSVLGAGRRGRGRGRGRRDRCCSTGARVAADAAVTGSVLGPGLDGGRALRRRARLGARRRRGGAVGHRGRRRAGPGLRRPGEEGAHAHDGHRRGRLHRLDPGRPAAGRGPRRSTWSTTSRPDRWPTWPRPGRPAGRALTIHQLDIRLARAGRADRPAPARGGLPPGRPGRRAGVGRPPGLRRRGQHPGHPPRARGRPAGPAPSGWSSPPAAAPSTASPTRPSLPVRESHPPPAALALRRVEEGGHRLPGRLPRAARRSSSRPGPGQRLRAPPGPPRRGRGGGHLRRAPARGRAGHHLRRRRADPGLRLRRRRGRRLRPGRRPAAAGLVLNIGTGRETLGQRALRDHGGRGRGRPPPPIYAPARPGELQRSCPGPRAGRDPARLAAVDRRSTTGTAAVLEHVRSARRRAPSRAGRGSAEEVLAGGADDLVGHRAVPEPRRRAPPARRPPGRPVPCPSPARPPPAISSATHTSVATQLPAEGVGACPAGRRRRPPRRSRWPRRSPPGARPGRRCRRRSRRRRRRGGAAGRRGCAGPSGRGRRGSRAAVPVGHVGRSTPALAQTKPWRVSVMSRSPRRRRTRTDSASTRRDLGRRVVGVDGDQAALGLGDDLLGDHDHVAVGQGRPSPGGARALGQQLGQVVARARPRRMPGDRAGRRAPGRRRRSRAVRRPRHRARPRPARPPAPAST